MYIGTGSSFKLLSPKPSCLHDIVLCILNAIYYVLYLLLLFFNFFFCYFLQNWTGNSMEAWYLDGISIRLGRHLLECRRWRDRSDQIRLPAHPPLGVSLSKTLSIRSSRHRLWLPTKGDSLNAGGKTVCCTLYNYLLMWQIIFSGKHGPWMVHLILSTPYSL